MSKFLQMVMCVGAMMGLPAGALAQSNQVVFSYGDFTQTPQTVRKIFLYPLYLPGVNPAGMTTLDRRTVLTDTSGVAVVTNMLAGLYRGEFQGVWSPTTNWFTVPATNGLVWASNCVASAYVLAGSKVPAYSMPQADARFAPIGSTGGGGGTGGVAVAGSYPNVGTTNNGVVT